MNDPEPLTGVNKPMSMTSLYLDSVYIEPNVGRMKSAPLQQILLKMLKLLEPVLGIDPKTNVTPDVSISLAQPDNNYENTRNDLDVHAPTLSLSLSLEKYQDKERPEYILNELGNKDKNSIDQPNDIVNIEELDSDYVPIGKRLSPGIAKRLKNKKGQVVWSSSTPSKSFRKKANVGPTKRLSKVVTPTPKKKSLKRKEVPAESSESDQDIEHNVHDIISTFRKQASGKKIPANILELPLNNISFHYVENVEKWKYVYQRRLALEMEFRKDDFECKEVLSLIQEADLRKTVTGFGKCYEMLVKEFIVNISKECDNKKSKEFKKLYVRGRCVDFSPEIINRFLGRDEEEQAKIEVSDNVIYKEITDKQVKEWPRKRKLSASALSVKYDVLHIIGASNWVPTNHTSNIAVGLGKFIYIAGTKSNFNFGAYLFDQTMKHDSSYTAKMPIAFTSLICGVIMSQHPNILIYFDSTIKRDPPLSLQYRLFTGKHALSEEEGGEKADGTYEEEDNKDIIVTSDEEETRSDED
ncbi:uncharacterized protein LOC127129517 [Lathyrus oleraceus]|uniref:uncharacterized protein LOC127129517 n=1 Tax=Pisum sativum TaxID=3888 RepID=UPI0021CF3DF0|nr:uncharacterized protein LOC127129517 [Pisum sativum]